MKLRCPKCQSRIVPVMEYVPGYHADEWDGNECEECPMQWDRFGNVIRSEWGNA